METTISPLSHRSDGERIESHSGGDLRIRESLGKPMFLTLEHHLFRDIFTGCNQPNRMVYSCLFKKILEGQWAMKHG